MEVDNAKKERYFFAIIIGLTLLLGISIGIYYNKSPSQSVNQTQTISIDTKETKDKININTASEKVLSTLPGIGEVKAKRIIEYRKLNGNFRNINDLLNVDGVGKETLDSIKESVVTE